MKNITIVFLLCCFGCYGQKTSDSYAELIAKRLGIDSVNHAFDTSNRTEALHPDKEGVVEIKNAQLCIIDTAEFNKNGVKIKWVGKPRFESVTVTDKSSLVRTAPSRFLKRGKRIVVGEQSGRYTSPTVLPTIIIGYLKQGMAETRTEDQILTLFDLGESKENIFKKHSFNLLWKYVIWGY